MISTTNSRKIFFDLDGTLIDTSERSYRLYRDILRKVGKPPLPKSRYLTLKRARTPLSTLLNATAAQDILKKFQREWKRLIESGPYSAYDQLSPSAREVLALLKKRYPLYLITLRRSRRLLLEELNRLKVKPYFRGIITAKETERDRFRAKVTALRGLATPNDIIIGDSETDIRAGKRLRLVTIGVAYGWRSKTILRRERPDYLVGNLKELLQLPTFKRK